MGTDSIGLRLLGVAFGVFAAVAILSGLMVAILMSPIIFVANAAITRGAGHDDRRPRSSRFQTDRPHKMAPIIDGECEVVDVGEVRSEPAFAQRRDFPITARSRR